MKTIRLLLLLLLTTAAALRARSEVVTFWFSGRIEDIANPSNAVPSGIAVGTPFVGRVSWDTAKFHYSSSNHYSPGSVANYYYKDPAAMSFLVQVGGHTITNAASVSGGYSGSYHVYDDFQVSDELSVSSARANLIVDGEVDAVAPVQSTLSLDLRAADFSTFTNAAPPTAPLHTEQFQRRRYFSWMKSMDDGKNTRLFSVGGRIDAFSTNALVLLNLSRLGDGSKRLSWPVGVEGFALQSSPNVANGPWTPVAQPATISGMERAVVVPPDNGPRFYRLAQ